MSRTVPMVDLKAQYGRIQREIDAAIQGVVESTQFVRGEACREFEAAFAEYCGVGHACGVANGTDALTLALRALGVERDDEVVTVANLLGETSQIGDGSFWGLWEGIGQRLGRRDRTRALPRPRAAP